MSDSLVIQGNRAAFTLATVDFEETTAVAKTAVKDAFQALTISFLGRPAVEVPGATRLEPPRMPAMDASLMLAELQETLNQLLQKVSVNDIKQNLQTQNDANKKQLETMQEGAKAAAAAAAKSKETEHKKNVWAAVAAWVGVAITVASIALTLVAAVGMLAAGNVVSAGALFVATAAMGVQLTCQVALAIDATMKANGNEKGLGIDVEKWTKVMEIAGYVALAASMVGMIGGLVAASSTAAKQATAEIAQEGVASLADDAAKKVATEVVEEGTKKVTTEVVEEGAKKVLTAAEKDIVKQASRAAMKQTYGKFFAGFNILDSVGELGYQGVKFAGKQVELNARREISDLQKEADLKQAEAEEIKARITVLQAMIDQLQKDLDEQMKKGEDVLQSLLTPITDRMKTLETLIQNIGA